MAVLSIIELQRIYSIVIEFAGFDIPQIMVLFIYFAIFLKLRKRKNLIRPRQPVQEILEGTSKS